MPKHIYVDKILALILGFGFAAGCSMTPQKTNFQAVPNTISSLKGYDTNFAVGFAVAENNSTPNSWSYGPVQKASKTQVSQNAKWHIGSITKSFTATLIMKLVEKGRLNLDIPINRYLSRYSDDMHPDRRALTLRQLLSHSAGVPANAPLSFLLTTKSLDPYSGRRHVLSQLWDKGLPHTTGRYLYSNIGYVLAGLIAEEVTQTTWETLIINEIASPLSMTSVGFGAPKGATDPKGHFSGLLVAIPVPANNKNSDNPPWMGPAGTLHMSLADLTKWGQAHVKACRGEFSNFLSKSSCQVMQTKTSDTYGLGWVIEGSSTSKRITHDGSNTLWYAKVSLDVTRGTVIAAATNSANSTLVESVIDSASAGQLVSQNGLQ